MHGILLPLVLLVAPAARGSMADSSAVEEEAREEASAEPSGEEPMDAGASAKEAAPRGRAAATKEADPLGELRLPSRVAWTVDVGGQPITLVPTRPSGGFKLTLELDF